jgi:amino acid adenylation domain-containing protein/non-ribosomal peptide synthase protein (TIGR01720 family)
MSESLVRKDNIEDLYALSPVQQGMLFHALLAEGASPYLEQVAWTLDGAVDERRFARALNLLIERHAILRTVFYEARKQPIQIVLRRLPVTLSVVDLRRLPPAARRAAYAAFCAADLARRLDPRAGPLLRGALVRMADQETKFVFTFDHMILDGWSLHPFCTDLLGVYGALARGIPPGAVDSPPYKDFVLWLSRRERGAALDFWARYLAGLTEPTPLPFDRRPAEGGPRHLAPLLRPLAATTSRQVAALARERRVTLGALIQGAWAVLLSRYGGGADSVFGLTVSGRPPELPGSDRMIGPFINTLPVRARLDDAAPFLDLARALMAHSVDLGRFGHLSLPDIQARSAVAPPRQLFDSILVVHNDALERSFSSPALRLIAEDEWLERTSYDLALDVVPGERPGQPLLAKWTYAREAFDAATIERLAASFERLLESVAARPEARIGELEILSPAELERLLVELNRTAPAREWPGGFPGGFERQVEARPDAVAAVSGAAHLSYAGLAARAARWGGRLRALGAGREVRVGVFGERGLGMLETIVGVLAAGAAWVPLEPAHPDARLAAILSDSGIALLATEEKLAARARALAGGRSPEPALLCWDEPLPGPAEPGFAWARPDGHDLANVFYTSGSTGTPKGAMVEQAGMLNHLGAKIALLGLAPASAVVQNAAHGFDISVWQMLAPLLAGGKVLFADEETAADPAELLAWLERRQATVFETVPTLLEELLAAAGETVELPALRCLISNAETLPVALCRRWLERFGHVPLVNTYGATECSDDTAHQVFRQPPPASSARVGVGRSIPGLRTYVLDRGLRPVPVGSPGQIAMAGVGLGRGYLGAPERTAATFVPDPFSGEGGRLYLSGDRGRFAEPGDLDLLGRLDGQVKVRGHRIELGEVEAALARHPAVRQAVAVALPDGRGGNRLIAYLVTQGRPSGAELKDFLLRTLPRTMLPERFVQLAALPLNRNGKVDRQALPEPAVEGGQEAYAAPRNALEAALAEVWQSVLGVERVGIHEDFFHLGGHSLKTIQVRSRIKHHLGVEVSLRALFDHPTIAGLAVEVARLLDGERRETGGATEGARIPRLPDAESYPLSHSQRRLWAWQRMNPGDVSYNMPVLYRLEGDLRPGALQRAFAALIERHATLRTSFATAGGEPVQRIAPHPTAGLALVDLSALPGDSQDAAIRAQVEGAARTPFDLATTPVRARLLRLAADRHLLLLVLHHIASDAWSWGQVRRDLLALYEAFAAGRDNPLPALPIRYVDYAAWQSERIRRGELAGAERYWLETLAGELPLLDLPADHPRPALPSQRGGRAALRPDAALVGRLRRLGQERDLTLFMTLFAAVAAFLSRVTGQSDLILGSPSAGRDHVDAEGLVGFFVNLLALRIDLAGDPTFLDLMGRARQVLLAAYAHQEYPFDLLVQKLNPVRELGRSPVFAATFVVHETSPIARVGGLTFAPEDLAAEQAMPYDVSFLVSGGMGGVGGELDLTWNLYYSRDLFAAETVERWLRRLGILLAGAATEPRLPLSELPYWTPQEIAELTLDRRPERAGAPLSFPQRDIWFQCQLDPGTPCYNCCLEVELGGPLDPAALARALAAVVERHDGLRAIFPVVDGRPLQQVAATVTPGLVELDFSRLARERRSAPLARWREELSEAPFDLARGPLYRFGLARLGPADARLLLVLHHLVIDAVNLVTFLEQALAAYAGLLAGEERPLPPLAVGYLDFAAWQAARLRLGALAAQGEYWRDRLRGGLPGLELAVDRPRPAHRRFAAGEVARRLPRQRLAELKGVRGKLGTSLFRLVLAALELLLSRLTGRTDLTVAIPVSIRPAAFAAAVGQFANALPLRTDLAGDPSFRELVDRVDAALSGAVQHADYPIDEAIARLKLERDASRPLLPICVSQIRSFDRRSGALSWRSGDPWSPGIPFDLWVLLGESGAGLEIHCKYDRDLLERQTVERLADGLEAVLAAVAAQPESRLSEVAILTPSERQRLLVDWNTAAARLPRDRFADREIERRAAAQPEAVAAVCDGEEVRYGELNARANRLAHLLRSRGIGREDRVALFGERGLGYLAAVLGVVKAGAAFVPLDADQPDARLRAILRSAGARALATQADLAARGRSLAAAAPAPPWVFCFDELPAEPESNPGCAHGPHDLACVFYTSGSTGTPKGAMVEHRGMFNHLCAKVELLELGPASVVAQNAPHGFDIWVWQSLAPLMAGGRVVIYTEPTASDPQALLHAVDTDGATVLETVPSFLDAMLQAAPASAAGAVRLPRLTHLVSNAETLPVALARRWFERFPHAALVNTYGATECSDDTTHHLMRVAPAESARQIPVGRPIPGFAIHVVDPYLELLPTGSAGHIVMAGTGVGRGYLGDVERTAQTFVPDPFAAASGGRGGRLYRTGDLGRWSEEGVLEFLGRRDHQVKIRGFRVELGEIEAALGRHPAVAEAVIAVRETAGVKRLVAYVVARQEPACDAAELRRFLAAALPEYMVPSAYVPLAAMPRTRTGKVDRRALPEPEGLAVAGTGGFVAPRTPVEERLAGIWAGVLGLGRIGVHDRFFDIGGDSILSIQVVSRAREAGLEITPRLLFQHPTIAELAAVARPVAERPAADRPGGGAAVEGAVPLTPIERWFFAQDNPRPDHWNMALLFELTRPWEPRLLAAAWERVVAHHDALRLRFACQGSGWRQWNAASEEHRFFSQIDLAGLAAAAQEVAVAAQTERLHASLDLAAGPLLRVAYFALGSVAPPRLLVIVHHLAVDVVSWRILLEDLRAAYEQLGRGEAVRLAEKTTSFQRWAELLTEHGRSAALQQELGDWLERLPGRIALLPVDRRAGPSDSGSLRHVTARFAADETSVLLRHLPARHAASLEAVLLTALAAAVARRTGERTLLVDLAGHGREEIFPGVDLTRTVGWFTCAFPFAVDLHRAATLEGALQEVGRQLRGVPNRGLGYGVLRYLAEGGEALSRLRSLPPAEVAFEYLGQIDAVLPPSWPLRLADQSAGSLVSPETVVPHLLEVTAKVEAGCLTVDWGYSRNRWQRPTIEALARDFAATLRALVESERRGTSTPLLPAPRAAGEPRILPDLLAAAAATAPADPFLLWGDDTVLSFAECDRAARRFAAGLKRLGVARGDRVAILMENRPELLTALFGSLLAGAVYVTVNPQLTPPEARYVVAHVGATVLVTEPRHAALVAAIRSACPELATVISAPAVFGGDGEEGRASGALPFAELLDEAPAPPALPAADIQPDDLAVIQYTSGTTAAPKGVMLTHRALLAAVRARVRHLRYGPDDTMLVVNPLFHLNGQGSILMCLSVRARVVLRDKFHASRFWEEVERHGVTTLNAMQTIPRILLARAPRPGDRSSALRTVVGILDPDLQLAFEERFGARFLQVYSLTEDPMSVMGPRDGLPPEWSAKRGAAGRPLEPETHQVRIVDDAGRDLPPGEPGEIVKRSPAMMQGYFRDPAATAAALRDGWLYTGDCGFLDEDGFLYFVGRKKDAIRRSGEMIAAAEVEAAIAAHPGIAEVAVVGVPDPIRSEEVKAFVVLADGYSEERLPPERILAHCAARLAAFKVPRYLEYRRELPKTATLKIRKEVLRAGAAAPAGVFDRERAARGLAEVRRP